MRRLGRVVAAAASFHGGRLAVAGDPSSPHLSADRITATVYVAGATNDDSFTAEQAALLARAHPSGQWVEWLDRDEFRAVSGLDYQIRHRAGGFVGRDGGSESVMHPMFVKLFIETDADDLLAYEEDKRRSRRARRSQARTVTRIAVDGRAGRPSRRP